MATLFVYEFQGIGKGYGLDTQAASVPEVTKQTVSFTGTAGTITNATNANTKLIYVFVDGKAAVNISGAGTAAVVTDFPMEAGTGQYFSPSIPVKVSAITRS